MLCERMNVEVCLCVCVILGVRNISCTSTNLHTMMVFLHVFSFLAVFAHKTFKKSVTQNIYGLWISPSVHPTWWANHASHAPRAAAAVHR